MFLPLALDQCSGAQGVVGLGGNSRENVVDADDTVRSGRAAVVHDGGVTLDPDPAAALGQEAVVPGGHLTLQQHYRSTEPRRKSEEEEQNTHLYMVHVNISPSHYELFITINSKSFNRYIKQ